MAALALLFFVLIIRTWNLQDTNGAAFAQQSAYNSLDVTTLLAPRGIITDVNGIIVAENVESEDGMRRNYPASSPGQIIGYVSYPKKDAKGIYYEIRTKQVLPVLKRSMICFLPEERSIAHRDGMRLAEFVPRAPSSRPKKDEHSGSLLTPTWSGSSHARCEIRRVATALSPAPALLWMSGAARCAPYRLASQLRARMLWRTAVRPASWPHTPQIPGARFLITR